LELALTKAVKRVVVKRPKLAPFLANQKPSFEVKSKTLRYDVYLTANK
jgi:16S rRNA (guanine1516-N2)-methyltransferase